MYEVTWISHAGEMFSLCSPNYRAIIRVYGVMRACGYSARLWDRRTKGAPVMVF